MKRVKSIGLITVLVLGLVLNLVMFVAPALASATPCTDAWADCRDAGGGAFCDAWWDGCMCGRYGYNCPF